MSSRELARVLLKVFGVGFLAYDVAALCVGVLQLTTVDSFARDIGWSALGYVLFPLLVAIFLLRQADWIADRLRIGSEAPTAPTPAADSAQLDPAALFRVGCALIGVYCLTRIAGPIATIVHELVRREPGDELSRWLSPRTPVGRSVIEIGLQLVFGFVLLVGPRRIARWFRRTFTASRPAPEPPASA